MLLLSLSLASRGGPGDDFENGDEKAAHVEIPNPFTVLVDKTNVTPTKPSIVGFEISLFSNLVCFSSLSLSRYSRPYYFFKKINRILLLLLKIVLVTRF